jgi:two-component system chemotaxis sensor kinase CheA
MEISGNQKVVQYRGKLMPLIPFSDKMKMKAPGPEVTQSVLVFSDRDRSMGLMVDEIVDIVEERIDVQIASGNNFGLLGSAIIHGQAMDVIDVGHFLSIAHSDWFGAGSDSQQSARVKGKKKKVLLVDDSPFFRNMLAPMLGVAGYAVTTANDAQTALSFCQKEKFDVIVSDIEMPGMSGFEFAKAIRGQGGDWVSVPMVALSSHASSEDLERGRAAGFTDYIPKFDREAILKSISNIGEAA